jgi:hypothetical protein
VEPTYDGASGTAGGPAFGAALAAAAAAEDLDLPALAAKAGLDEVEFMQKTGLLSLEVYAMGLDPLYFLPDGPIRYDARIYMREINPRHAVPEGDMLKRNPVLAALRDDPILDPLGRLELELTYLLRAAIQSTGGTL